MKNVWLWVVGGLAVGGFLYFGWRKRCRPQGKWEETEDLFDKGKKSFVYRDGRGRVWAKAPADMKPPTTEGDVWLSPIVKEGQLSSIQVVVPSTFTQDGASCMMDEA